MGDGNIKKKHRLDAGVKISPNRRDYFVFVLE